MFLFQGRVPDVLGRRRLNDRARNSGSRRFGVDRIHQWYVEQNRVPRAYVTNPIIGYRSLTQVSSFALSKKF